MMVPHEYALNAVAVVQLPQIFDCAIHFGYLLAQDFGAVSRYCSDSLARSCLETLVISSKEETP